MDSPTLTIFLKIYCLQNICTRCVRVRACVRARARMFMCVSVYFGFGMQNSKVQLGLNLLDIHDLIWDYFSFVLAFV